MWKQVKEEAALKTYNHTCTSGVSRDGTKSVWDEYQKAEASASAATAASLPLILRRGGGGGAAAGGARGAAGGLQPAAVQPAGGLRHVRRAPRGALALRRLRRRLLCQRDRLQRPGT